MVDPRPGRALGGRALSELRWPRLGAGGDRFCRRPDTGCELAGRYQPKFRCSRWKGSECLSRVRYRCGWPKPLVSSLPPPPTSASKPRAGSYSTITSLLGTWQPYRFQFSLNPQPPHPAVLSFLKSRVEGAFSIFEKHLTDRSFVVGDRPTIADLSMAGYLYYPPEEIGFDLEAAFPAIHAWCRRLAALPGWKPPHELMPLPANTCGLKPAAPTRPRRTSPRRASRSRRALPPLPCRGR